MAVYGLTGGIGTGKSTVCRMLQALGITVLAGDDIGRQVVEPETPGLAALVAAFGTEVLERSGALDRRKLGALVFGDSAKRRQLEDIMHPLVKSHSQARFAALTAAGVPIIIYESALLFETQRHHEMRGTILVTASEAQRIARVQQRDHTSVDAVRARMQAQLDDTTKRQLATYILENTGDLAALQHHVQAVVTTLRQAVTSQA